MAIKENLTNDLFSLYNREKESTEGQIPWQDFSGDQVEDYITRRLDDNKNSTIVRGTYEGTLLTLYKADGTSLEPISVTPADPEYNFGMLVYGIRIDGSDVIYTKSDTELILLYKNGRKIEVGIALYATTTIIDKVTDRQGPFNIKIAYGSRNAIFKVATIKKENCILDPNTLLVTGFNIDPKNISWIDVTELFNKQNTGATITATLITSDVSEIISSTLPTKIVTEIIYLSYAGKYIINNPSISFTLNGGTSSNYKLIGYDNGNKVTSSNLTYTLQEGGVHKLAFIALHNKKNDISSDPFYIDIIYTKDFENTALVVNGVSSGINNNDIATLYLLNVYSPKLEDVEIITYIEDNLPNNVSTNPELKTVTKHEVISGSTYKDGMHEVSYQKYIEILNRNAVKYLFVKVNGELYSFYDIYSFLDESAIFKNYTSMLVELVIEDFTYFKDVPPAFNFDQMSGYTNNIFITKQYSLEGNDNINDIEASDGWKEDKGLVYFKVSAQNTPVFKEPINLLLTSLSTIELGFRTYNVSNENLPILSIGDFQLRPTLVCWNTTDNALFKKRNSLFRENTLTHVVITILEKYTITDDLYYPDFLGEGYQENFDAKVGSQSLNLVRIFINGTIDREIILTETELKNLTSATMLINPTSADIDIYLARIYNTHALSFSEIQRNYISFLCSGDRSNGATKNLKQSFYDHNDILFDSGDRKGEISFEKCYGKLNTLVYVFPKGGKFPHRFWGGVDGNAEEDVNKKLGTTLFVSYANPDTNKQYGGRLTHGLVKGLGSSAMKYLIWNVNYSLNKLKYAVEEDGEEVEKKINSLFVAYNQMDENNRFIADAAVTEKYYNMPPYTDQKDVNARTNKYKKMVGKVNFASSMQSHKIGACKLYNDAYYNSLGSLQSGGLKAVHEEPFMYFYWESDYTYDRAKSDDPEASSVAFINLLDLFDNNDKIKFMGFLTWGPGKGDDACSGYDEDITPEYLILEGGENKDASVNFRRPWLALQRSKILLGGDSLETTPQISYEDSIEHPDYNMYIHDESVVYTVSETGIPLGAWDIDYGCEEVEVGDSSYFKFNDKVLPSLKHFRAFYDDVYNYNYDLIFTSETEPTNWNTERKYVVTNSGCSIDSGHDPGNMYRYDESLKTWVNAGVSFSNGSWDRVNVYTLAGVNTSSSELVVKRTLQDKFKEAMSKYIDINDVAFHQAFIKFLSGTDNRAKNTYFQIIGRKYEGDNEVPHLDKLGQELDPYLIRLIGDDLDTIFVTDNNGLLSKPYNLLEASYDESFRDYWGDARNAFFYMFDLSYETEIIKQLREILTTSQSYAENIDNKDNYLTKVFFNVQSGFPAVAYNHTAKIYYENAQVIKDSKIAGFYSNNDIQPIEQSHGSCLECEKQFMSQRIAFLSGYAQALLNDSYRLKFVSETGGTGAKGTFRFIYTPYLDFYPNYLWGPGNIKRFPQLNNTDYSATKYLAKAGVEYTTEIKHTDTAINQGLFLPNLYKSLNITGFKNTVLDGNFDRMVNFEMDNANKDSYFDKDYPDMALSGGLNASFPVLESLVLRNMALESLLDLTACSKLKTIDLQNTTTEYVMFPETGILQTVILPSTLKQFRIYNNPGLTEVIFEDYSNIKNVYIDCAKCGEFNVEEFIENLSNNTLESVTLRNAELSLTEEALRNLLYAKNCIIEGTITIINSIEDRTPKNISFNTKLLLVENFGNIDDENNSLYIIYRKSDIYKANISYNKEISIFYLPGEEGTVKRPNLFSLSVSSGNNIRIKETNGKTHLDVTYSLTGVNSSYATIDQVTGDITMHKESSNPAKVTITLNTDKSSITTETITVYFLWLAPKIGDFVYADGSYSRGYDPNKTMMGLIYAIDITNSEEGIVHLIGTEYSQVDSELNLIGLYSGYNPRKADGNATESQLVNLNSLKIYVNNTLRLLNYEKVENIEGVDDIDTKYDNIDIVHYKSTDNNVFSGKQDTLSYIAHVNDNLLPKLERNYSRFIKNGVIENHLDLVDFCIELDRDGLSGNIASCLLYPYFYSTYLYTPTVKEGEIFKEELFGKGKWYVPSLPELARVIYYRGYSAAGEQFNSPKYVTSAIDTTISEQTNILKKPIFSIAKNIMKNSFPTVWDDIAKFDDGNNITTSVDTNDTDNYGYTSFLHPDGTKNYYEWFRGGFDDYNDFGNNSWDYYYAPNKTKLIWRLNKHCGVPFVQFKYSKNDGLSSN